VRLADALIGAESTDPTGGAAILMSGSFNRADAYPTPSRASPCFSASAMDKARQYILRVPCEMEVPGFSVSSNTIKLSATAGSFNRSQVSWAGNALTFVQPALAMTSFGATDRGRIERIDLDVSLLILDLDGNGLPDDWERLYFGRTGIDPFADPDKDGMNNLAE